MLPGGSGIFRHAGIGRDRWIATRPGPVSRFLIDPYEARQDDQGQTQAGVDGGIVGSVLGGLLKG